MLMDMSTALSLINEIICKAQGKLHILFHSKSLNQNILFVVRTKGPGHYFTVTKPFSTHPFQDPQDK